MLDKVTDPDKLVEMLRVLLEWETNGEVIYWTIMVLEEMKDIPGALDVVYNKLDKGAYERFEKYIKNDMVIVPDGRFVMGSNDVDDEKPMFRAKMDNFLISKYTITNKLYEVFDPGHKQKRDKYSQEDNQPVLYVNWYEAYVFL